PSSTPQVPASDAARRFVGARAKLTAIAAAPTKYPEYDRLWGFGPNDGARQRLVVYAFVGVESNERDSQDLGAIEYQRLLRTLRGKFPSLAVTYTNPQAVLRQQVIDNFSERWIYWDMPATVTMGGATRQMTVELRTFWGVEDDGTA